MTFVSTFCCSFVLSAPVPSAFLRIRWTASMTSLCWREEGVAELGRPLDVVGQALDRVGQARHPLDAGVPRLLGHGVRQGLALQVLVLHQPLLKLDDLERVGGGHEDLSEELVGIEGDRRHQGIELIGRQRFTRGRLGGAVGRLGGGRRRLREKRCISGGEEGRAHDCDEAPAGPPRDRRSAASSGHGARLPSGLCARPLGLCARDERIPRTPGPLRPSQNGGPKSSGGASGRDRT